MDLEDFRRCRRGTTAVEFSLIAFPLLLMIFGTMEIGRVVWTRTALRSVATATARCMGLVQSQCGNSGTYSASMTASNVQALAKAATIMIPAAGVTLDPAANCAGVSGFSKASITTTFNIVAPQMLGSFANVQLTETACFPNQS